MKRPPKREPIPDRPIEVTVILLDGGYASTAIGPLEVSIPRACSGTG